MINVVWTETALKTFFSVIDYLADYWSAKENLKNYSIYNVPLFACSLSILSKSALKFPAPKPFAPIR